MTNTTHAAQHATGPAVGPLSRSALLALALLAWCLVWSLSAAAQNIQFTQGSVGSGPDNAIQVPVIAYPGRGSACLTVNLYYSSKVWRLGHLETIHNNRVVARQTVAEAIYAEHSTSGWTTSLDMARIKWRTEKDHYNLSGAESCGVCQNGLSYKFDYNQYGEMAKVTYPAGGCDPVHLRPGPGRRRS
jgi:hypothetical protein